MNFLDRLYKTPTRLIYLSAFRILLSCIVLEKAFNTLPYLRLLYDSSSFDKWHGDAEFYYIPLNWMDHNYTLFYYVYIVLAILMLVGYGRNLTVFLVYVCNDITQHANGFTLDGGDNLLKFLLFYLSFCDSFQYFVLRRQTLRPAWRQELSNLFTNTGVFLIIAHLLLVYFISGTGKAHSEVWYNGTALYYILNNDRFSIGPWNTYLTQNVYFVVLGTYSTMMWEIAFPFLIWIKSLRFPLIAFGIVLHMGIFFMMMIHEFEIIFISTYGFFYSDQEFKQFGVRCLQWWKNAYLLYSKQPIAELT
jgi:hypothetical protein